MGDFSERQARQLVRINRAVLYIESNTEEHLTLDQIAQVACLSPFHFHRLFTATVGESVYDYIKRLRLERAALHLRYSSDTVDTISERSGYAQPTSFSKAFRDRFGESPRQYRAGGSSNGPPESQQKPQVSLVELPAQRVAYTRVVGSYDGSAQKAWQSLLPIAFQWGLITEQTRAMGITYDSPEITIPDRIRYDACISLAESSQVPDKLLCQTISGGRFARFRHLGPYEALEASFQYIYGEWLPGQSEELRDAPVFCHYHQLDPRQVAPESLVTDIYLPLR